MANVYNIEVFSRDQATRKTFLHAKDTKAVEEWIDNKIRDGYIAINIILEGVIVRSKVRSFRIKDVPINEWY